MPRIVEEEGEENKKKTKLVFRVILSLGPDVVLALLSFLCRENTL